MALDIIASANIKDTLSSADASDAVVKVLAHSPHLIGLQEWDGRAPACIKGTKYRFARAVGGGGPVLYDSTRYELLRTRTRILAPAGFVGVLPGRRTHLGDSKAAVYVFADERGGPDTVVINVHLTAEVQIGDGYREDRRHALRVARHKLERFHLGLLTRHHVNKGRRVYVTGDTNFDSMTLRPLVSCWVNHGYAEAAGTLGSRTVDYVYAQGESLTVRLVATASDHDAVVAIYRRRL